MSDTKNNEAPMESGQFPVTEKQLLSKNCRFVSVEEAVEMYNCCETGGYVLNDGVLVTPQYHASRPILGSEFTVMFSVAGTYLCMDAESARLFHERVRAQNAHERVKTARGSVNDSAAVGAEGSGCQVDVAGGAVSVTSEDSIDADDVNLAVFVGNSDELGHAESVTPQPQ